MRLSKTNFVKNELHWDNCLCHTADMTQTTVFKVRIHWSYQLLNTARRKAKSPWKYYWKWSAKVVFRTKNNSAGQCSVCLFQRLCKNEHPIKGIQYCFGQFEKSWPQQGREQFHRLGLPSETVMRKASCTLRISEMVFYLSGTKKFSPGWLAANRWGFSFLKVQLSEFTFPASAVRCAPPNFKHNDSSEWLPL